MNRNSTTTLPSLAKNRCLTTLIPLLLLLLATTTARAQTTYYWRGAANASFTAATSWNTSPTCAGSNRTSAAASDILVFNGGTPVVTMAGQTIGRPSFINNTSVALNSASNATNTILINGDATDDDLIVESGSSVAITATGTSGSTAGVVLSLGTSATGKMAGTITLTNAATNSPDSNSQLKSGAGDALHFKNGGQLIILGTQTGTALTNTPLFESGSTLEQNAAATSDHTTLATYQPGSTFRYIDGAFGGTATGIDQTSGNLEFAGVNDKTMAGTLNLTIVNNLIMSGNDTVTFTIGARGNGAGATGTLIGGNISVTNPNATLLFNATGGASPKAGFNGTTAQTISSTSLLAFGTNTKLEINNPAGVTLLSDLTISNELLLTNGLLTTTASGSGLLTMMAAAPTRP